MTIQIITQEFIDDLINERKLLGYTAVNYIFKKCFINEIDFRNISSIFYFENCLIRMCSFDESTTNLRFIDCTLDFVTFNDCESLAIIAKSTNFYDCSMDTEEKNFHLFISETCNFVNFYINVRIVNKKIREITNNYVNCFSDCNDKYDINTVNLIKF